MTWRPISATALAPGPPPGNTYQKYTPPPGKSMPPPEGTSAYTMRLSMSNVPPVFNQTPPGPPGPPGMTPPGPPGPPGMMPPPRPPGA